MLNKVNKHIETLIIIFITMHFPLEVLTLVATVTYISVTFSVEILRQSHSFRPTISTLVDPLLS